MANKLFLYIDILGFKELIKSGENIYDLYNVIDELNVHTDNDFKCIVFSDTILVYGNDFWLNAVNQGIMWLIEFSQDLFYRLIVKDIHFRAYVTFGEFEHYKLKNIEAYYGDALVNCYEREKEIKCVGVFLDPRLVSMCDIFHVTKYDETAYFVHVMQHLDEVSWPYEEYPIPGEIIESTGMEWWIAYFFRYLENIYKHASDTSLPEPVRLKYQNAWSMISKRHPGPTRRLADFNFDLGEIVDLDWSEPVRRIGTDEGAWG